MDQKDYWNSVANSKSFTTPFQIDLFNKYVSKDGFILDIGCGYGRTLNELYNVGYKNSIGIDFSAKMVEKGIKLFPFLNLKIMENNIIEYPENTFDAIILFAVLTCIIKNEAQLKLINLIYKILKPNGIIYVNDFLLNNDERNNERYNEYSKKYGQYGIFELPEGAIVRHHKKEYIKELLGKFDELEYKEITYTTMNGHKSNGFYYIGGK
jgi:SAM-dependent methyltransferase